jgi:hypothetical protein
LEDPSLEEEKGGGRMPVKEEGHMWSTLKDMLRESDCLVRAATERVSSRPESSFNCRTTERP